MRVEPSIIGLGAQAAAISLVAVLAVLLSRSMKRQSLRYWTAAWCSLVASLAAFLGSILFPGAKLALMPVYFLGHYGFGYLVFAGCRSYAKGTPMRRGDAWLLVPGAAVAVGLTAIGRGALDLVFMPHAALVSYLFFAAHRSLHSALPEKMVTSGVRVMSAALLLLGFTFLHYIPLYAYSAVSEQLSPVWYLAHTSLYDLLFEVLLGFGMVMQVMEEVALELAWSNRELSRSRDRLEGLARLDPLTQALNRRGLASSLERWRRQSGSPTTGSVILADLDHLKQINDTLGHAAGDSALRVIARSLRSVIRPDDLLIRWGGDEFLILLFGVPEQEARRRLEGLGPVLERVALPGTSDPTTLSFSFGVAPFDATVGLDAAIDQADAAMYQEKERRRTLVGA